MANMIRKMQPKEIDNVGNIWLQGNLEAHPFVKKDYWIGNLNSVKEQFKEAEIYVSVDKNQIVGFAGLQGNYLAGIFVKKEFRSQSFGGKLLVYLKQEYSELSLEVYSKNIQAKKFYLRNGFKVIHKDIDESTDEVEYQMIWRRG